MEGFFEKTPSQPTADSSRRAQCALTDQINDREVYMKGVDASYRYEGYNTYTTGDV